MTKTFAILTVFLCKVALLQAQPYYFRHYSVENGLSNNSVHSSIQDENGFLWFGTKGGLNRYDGYRFKAIQLDRNNETALTRDVIYCMYPDENGNIWIGTQRGLYRYDDQKEKITFLIDSLREINEIQKDAKGNLWFIAGADLCMLNLKTSKIRLFPAQKYFVATSICRTENGNLWISSADGKLFRYDELEKKFIGFNLFGHSKPANYNWITKILDAGNDHILVGTTSQGIKLFNSKTGTYRDLYCYNEDRSPVYVRDILRYSENEFWFATESGIIIIDLQKNSITNLKKKFLDPYSLNDNAVYTLTKDKEGGVWAGTYFGGINYYSRQYSAFQKFFPDHSGTSIGGSVVREIESDMYGNIWIGTEDAGLSKLNAATGKIEQFKATGLKTDIAYSNIHGLLADGNDLWVGTFENGLDILDIRTGKVRKHYSSGTGKKDLKQNFIVTLLKTKSGHRYIGTSSAVYKYDPVADGFDRVTAIPEFMFISALLESHDGTIWITTHNRGLFHYDPLTDQVTANYINDPNNNNSLSNNTINSIYEDNKHNLWIGTEGGGLCRLSSDKKTFERITVKEGLPSNFVFKAIPDDQGKLWITTAKGLVSYDPAGKIFTLYTRSNGLLTDQFNYNSGFKDNQGNLYFGSVAGLIKFNPRELSKSEFNAPIYITGFQLNNKELSVLTDSSILDRSISMTKKIKLDYHQSSFSIDFAALSFTSPEITEYSYMMEGVDDKEVHLKSNRKVYFTDLSPGNYTFKVKAAVNGKWSPNETKLQIVIMPPFWATHWAFLLYVSIALIIAHYIIRYYKHRSEERKEKEIYEAKIDFFTNITHEIRTPLTLIKGPLDNIKEVTDDHSIIKEDVITMERNTNRLLALLTQLLDFRKTETKGFSLDFSKVDIVTVLRENIDSHRQMAYKKKLDYKIEINTSSLIADVDEEAINKILGNLVNNAVKYADRFVCIRLNNIHPGINYFRIEIMNDGYLIPEELKETVFEPFYRAKETCRQKGNGIGLTLARSLTELHQGKLYLDNSQNMMNVFVLEIPLSHIEEKKQIKEPRFKKLVRSFI